MRLVRKGTIAAVLGLVALAMSVVPGASARPADDDVVLTIMLAHHGGDAIPGTTTTALSFGLVFEIETSTGVVQTVKLTVALPAGLSWEADTPDPGEGCQ